MASNYKDVLRAQKQILADPYFNGKKLPLTGYSKKFQKEVRKMAKTAGVAIEDDMLDVDILRRALDSESKKTMGDHLDIKTIMLLLLAILFIAAVFIPGANAVIFASLKSISSAILNFDQSKLIPGMREFFEHTAPEFFDHTLPAAYHAHPQAFDDTFIALTAAAGAAVIGGGAYYGVKKYKEHKAEKQESQALQQAEEPQDNNAAAQAAASPAASQDSSQVAANTTAQGQNRSQGRGVPLMQTHNPVGNGPMFPQPLSQEDFKASRLLLGKVENLSSCHKYGYYSKAGEEGKVKGKVTVAFDSNGKVVSVGVSDGASRKHLSEVLEKLVSEGKLTKEAKSSALAKYNQPGQEIEMQNLSRTNNTSR